MKSKKTMQALLKNEMFTLVLVLLAVCVVMSILSDTFLTPGNLMNVLRQSAQYGIIAIGMTMIVLLGGIDLSVGSTQAMAGVAAVWVLNQTNSIALAIVTGVAVGAVIGLINSLIITKMKIPPMICTLGTMSIIRGLILIITGAVSIQVKNMDYMQLGMGRFLSVPIPVWILLGAIIVFYYVLNFTTFGRSIYAIGGNKAAAELAGIPVQRVTIISWVLSGCLTGLAAVILSSRLGSGQASAGEGFEMTVIAAVIIGGISLNGGRGNLLGAILGVLTLYTLTNGLILMDVSSFWQEVIRGALVVLAVYVDNCRSNSTAKRLLQASFAQAEREEE